MKNFLPMQILGPAVKGRKVNESTLFEGENLSGSNLSGSFQYLSETWIFSIGNNISVPEMINFNYKI